MHFTLSHHEKSDGFFLFSFLFRFFLTFSIIVCLFHSFFWFVIVVVVVVCYLLFSTINRATRDSNECFFDFDFKLSVLFSAHTQFLKYEYKYQNKVVCLFVCLFECLYVFTCVSQIEKKKK